MIRINQIPKQLKNIYNKLTSQRVVKFSLYASLLIFLPGLLIAVLIAYFFGPESYNIINNYISDLGSFRYTPTPFILDGIAMVTAILLIPVHFYITKTIVANTRNIILDPNQSFLKRFFYGYVDIHALLGLISLITASIGLFGIGLFSEDRTTNLGLHFTFSILVFTSLAFGALFNGIAILLKKTIFSRILGLYMMIGPFTSAILFVFPPYSVTLQFLEWIMLFAAFLWLIPIAFLILKNLRTNKPNI